LMSALPGFTVITPADATEVEAAVRAMVSLAGPCYLRLYRSPTPVVHNGECRFILGKAEAMRQGNAASIIACGSMVSTALAAADKLASEGVNCLVLNMHTLKPLDEDAIVRAALETGAIVTAEEHYIYGGLGSLVSQVVGRECPVPMEMVALRGYAESGKPEPLLEKYGLTAADVEKAVRRVLKRKG
ncbi:MAG: transketolase family protein, partial [Chloroflexi bacterium]|nr:transketolase family protein [Chloroflexota bacterium]